MEQLTGEETQILERAKRNGYLVCTQGRQSNLHIAYQDWTARAGDSCLVVFIRSNGQLCDINLDFLGAQKFKICEEGQQAIDELFQSLSYRNTSEWFVGESGGFIKRMLTKHAEYTCETLLDYVGRYGCEVM